MPYKKFKEMQELRPETEDSYHEALGCLPPLYYNNQGGLASFLMLEMLEGDLTRQYANYKGHYASKIVDSKDRSTWITTKHFEGIV